MNFITNLLEPIVKVVAILLPKPLYVLIFNSEWWFEIYEKHTTRHKKHVEQIRNEVEKIKKEALKRS